MRYAGPGKRLADGQAQQARQGAMQVDRQALAIGPWGQHDLFDQRPERFLCFLLALGVGEAADQLADAVAIGLRHAGMKPDRVRGRGG
ncbi:hypothetical protein [Paracoccus aestuarii]|uniref:hypothetical protein n=1 Tax=Paracoccus aestuarii TaxID=453842 RepID=UPI001F0B8C37|nr:hypothetical protein [Paracoccus aestuarii]